MKEALTLQSKIEIKTAKKGTDFVGLNIDSNKIQVTFPIGYDTSFLNKKDLEDSEIRKELIALTSIIIESGKKREGSFSSSFFNKNGETNEFPVSACIYLIIDFFENGLYKNQKQIIKKEKSGKINWTKTIKAVLPLLTKDRSPIYVEYMVQKSLSNNHELITQIHEYCVWWAFNAIGFLFATYKPHKPNIKFNKKLFIYTISKNMQQTFSRRNIMLFQNMLALLNCFDDENGITKLTIGTTDFEHVWEYMIDKAYGQTENFRKEDFFPYSTWYLYNPSKEGNAGNLYPDTIMLYKENDTKKCAIIDAKYYGYHSGDCSSLPSMESIAKQIHYGQYIFSKAADFGLSEPEKSIINIFLIPKELTPIYKDIEYIGCAIEPWNLAEFNYKKILCFAIDTRSLIMDYSKNDIRKAILTNNARKIIEEEFPCEH